MPVLGLGELCALLAPLAWSLAVIFYKRADALPPISMNLFKNSVAIALLSATMVALGVRIPMDRPMADWARLIGSGVIGLALGDTLLFAGLARIGAARLAVVDTLYAPLVIALAWAFLGESVGPNFLVGAGAVLAGIALANRRDPNTVPGPADPKLIAGVLLAMSAIGCTAVGVILAKPALVNGDLVEVTCTRLVAGTAAQLAFTAVRGSWSESFQAFTRRDLWRHMIPGSVIGTYLSLLLWLGGFKWGDASVAAVLNQMATVYMIVLARSMLGEELRPAQVAGGGLAAGGALWIVLTR